VCVLLGTSVNPANEQIEMPFAGIDSRESNEVCNCLSKEVDQTEVAVLETSEIHWFILITNKIDVAV